jgi:hypothetical protein
VSDHQEKTVSDHVCSVGLTADIEPLAAGGGVPTGLVTFEFVTKLRKKVSVKTLGTVDVSGGKATLTFKLNPLLEMPLRIVYSGHPTSWPA